MFVTHNVSTNRWREKRTRRMVVLLDIFLKKSMIYYASWTMELWYSERGVQRSSCVGIETTDGGDQDQETGARLHWTTRNTQLNCLVSLWTRITRDGPAVGSPTRILSEIFRILSEIPHFISKSTNNYCYRAGQMVSISHNLDGVCRLGAGIILSSTTVAFCNLSTSPF